MSTEAVPFQRLLQKCLEAAYGAGAIIRHVHETGTKITDKHGEAIADVTTANASAVLTQADVQAQHFVMNTLQTSFPHINIVGEEESTQPHSIDSFKPETPPEVPAFELAATWEDLVVWVDPLDGTKEFACGRLENCCVLIGVSVKKRAVAGVIYCPFTKVVCWGAQNLGVFVGDGPLPSEKRERKTVTFSSDHPPSEALVQQLLEQNIAEEVHRVGGCGKKMLNVLLGKADAVIQLPGSYRWDICAGEALIHAVGGLVLDMNGNKFVYDGKGDAQNLCGMIASKDSDVLQRLAAITRGTSGKTT